MAAALWLLKSQDEWIPWIIFYADDIQDANLLFLSAGNCGQVVKSMNELHLPGCS